MLSHTAVQSTKTVYQEYPDLPSKYFRRICTPKPSSMAFSSSLLLALNMSPSLELFPPSHPHFSLNIFIIHTKPLDISWWISKQSDSSLYFGDSCENELPDCLKASCYFSFQLVRMASQVLLFSISGPLYFQFFRFLLFPHNDSLLISPDLLLPSAPCSSSWPMIFSLFQSSLFLAMAVW